MIVRILVPSLAATFAVLAAAALWHGPAGAQSASSIDYVGIDPVTSGNTATSLGPRDGCARVEPGAQTQVDVVEDRVPPEHSDPNLLQVTDINNELFLASNGSFEPFEGLSDPLPDTDGNVLIEVADLASNNPDPGSNMETGPGVLSRLTFQAKAVGTSTISIGFQPNPPNDEYPEIIIETGGQIEVNKIGAAQLAIGQDCSPTPPGASPGATPGPQITQLPPLASIQPPTDTPGPGDTAAPTPTLGPNDTPRPTGSGTPGGGSASPSGSAAAGGSATGTPRPSLTPGVLPAAGSDSDGSDTAAIIAVALLGAAGVALAGGGGWLLYKRLSAR